MKNNKTIRDSKIRRNTTTILCTILVASALIPVPFSNASVSTNEGISTMPVSQSGWEIQQSGTTQTLRGVSFVNTNIGTAVGDSATILHTEDEGDTWTSQTCGPSVDLFDVSFSDADMGVAVGEQGTIIYTTNGGDTWITHQTGWLMQYYGAHMETSTIGVLVGESSIFAPMVTWTTDGWQTHTTKGFYLNNNEGSLWDVHYSSSTTWYVAASVWNGEGAIARTTDGGSNWETIYWADRAFFGMDFPSSNIGYAVGLAGIIVKTTDGGNTWNPLSSGVDTTLLDVSFSTDNIGTVVGQDGLILRTEDGGVTWTVQESGTTYDLLAVQFINSNIGSAVGEHGTILHTTSGGYPEDTTPPETTCTLEGEMNGSIYISDVTVTLTANDSGSGVNYTTYKLDNGSWITYTTPFVVSEEGDHTVFFYSVDNAGNIEDEKSCTFKIQHPVELEITVKGGIGVSAVIKNTGTSCLENIPWTIELTGGFIIIGKTKNGTIPEICPGNETIVNSFVFGFGKPMITVTAGDEKKTATGVVILFFVLGVK